jgi:hypothetical protein
MELEEGCEEERVRSMVYGGVGGQERVGADRERESSHGIRDIDMVQCDGEESIRYDR